MAVLIPLKWSQSEYPILWNNNPYTWNEAQVLQEVESQIQHGGAPLKVVNKLDSNKKRVLIKLIAKIKGEEYNVEKYKSDNIKISAKDVKLLIHNNVLNIQINK
jgi:hypothetical protein